VIYKEAIQKIELPHLPTIENLLSIAMSEFEARHYQEAATYFNRVLELDSEHWWSIFFKSVSQCRIAPLKSLPVLSLIESTKKSFAIAERCNTNEELLIIKDVFLKAFLMCLSSIVDRADLSKYMIFDSMDTFIIHTDNYVSCFLGYKYCLSIFIEIPHNNSDQVLIINKILFLLSEVTVHRKVSDGRFVGTPMNNRKYILAQFDAYKEKLLSLDRDATIPSVTYDNVETAGITKKYWWE